MFDPSAPHIIILLIVVLLLFGSRRLPGAAKSLGQSMHIFKRSISGLDSEDDAANPYSVNSANPATPALPPAACCCRSWICSSRLLAATPGRRMPGRPASRS